ncbi:MAG TPA: VOC family protein [Fimbriimonas sp.]|nr:VOC family protein [Fimbriimonas sp.]
MLGRVPIIAFVATTDAERARAFYSEMLGLEFVADEPYALIFSANGTRVRIAKVEQFEPFPFTVLGWQVSDIGATVLALTEKGLEFVRYGFLEQDSLGVWSSGNAKVAWFKDPDGNVLSLTEF